jgi:hypothetical protein
MTESYEPMEILIIRESVNFDLLQVDERACSGTFQCLTPDSKGFDSQEFEQRLT